MFGDIFKGRVEKVVLLRDVTYEWLSRFSWDKNSHPTTPPKLLHLYKKNSTPFSHNFKILDQNYGEHMKMTPKLESKLPMYSL